MSKPNLTVAVTALAGEVTFNSQFFQTVHSAPSSKGTGFR